MRDSVRRLGRNLRRRVPGAAVKQPPEASQARKTRPRAKPADRPQPKAEPAPATSTAEHLLVRQVQRGAPLDAAIMGQVRSLIAAGDTTGAQSFSESLRAHSATEELGRLAVGVTAFHRELPALAWDRLRGLPDVSWGRFAAEEYVRSGLHQAPEETLEEVRRLVKSAPPEIGADGWFRMLGPVFGLGEVGLARQLFDVFQQRLHDDPSPRQHLRLQSEWLEPWVAAEPASVTAPRRDVPRFAVVDYGHPGMTRASANIGDHVQSIASLGHLVRHQGVRFHGQEDLVDLLQQLRSRTRGELQKHDVQADLEVMTIHRDASMYQEVPEGTWVLCFGWFMHALFKMRYGFPLHRGLRPIFVSFHCNKRELLTDDAIEYLRRYGPVGCRDWTTVYLLLSVGVPAFFSGCVTTTVNTVFPDLAAGPGPDAPVAYVDVPEEDVPQGAPTFKHSSGEVRTRSFIANCYTAVELLETYRRKHRAVVTSRLHCYLPLRSMGVDVDFQPKNRSDIRFDGLVDITDEAFDEIRNGILEKLDRVFSSILANTPEEDVYALWREITAGDVRAAEAKRDAEMRMPELSPVVLAEVEQAVSDTVTHEGRAVGDDEQVMHCAVELAKGEGRSLQVLVASLVERSSRPLHVWVLANQATTGKLQQRLSGRFPQVTFSWVPTRRLGRGLSTPTGERARVSRLVIDRLLPGVPRVVLLPMPAVLTADVSELADLDLGGAIIAAPTTVDTAHSSGFGVIHSAAQRLEHRTQLSAALRRTAHARHTFDFDAFDTDVLVLDLERMRSTGFTDQALPLVEEFGLTEREVFHYVLGPGHATVPTRWAHVPTRSPDSGPGLTYFADPVKPWDARFTPQRDLWRRYAQDV